MYGAGGRKSNYESKAARFFFHRRHFINHAPSLDLNHKMWAIGASLYVPGKYNKFCQQGRWIMDIHHLAALFIFQKPFENEKPDLLEKYRNRCLVHPRKKTGLEPKRYTWATYSYGMVGGHYVKMPSSSRN